MTIHEEADLLILGGGFAGALMALTARRVGLRPVVLEKGRHPRFAVGESSTPIANLVLEGLTRTYDLPRLLPLAKYGPWQRAYPHLACGLKRGFTFVKHEPGHPFLPRPDHAKELLVAASPRDDVGDTHWYREHFDQFLIQEVQAAGVPYYDQTEVVALEHGDGWRVRGVRLGSEVKVAAAFLIDATGPSGLLPRTLGIDASPADVRTNAWSVYTHFREVGWWKDVLVEHGGATTDHPYPCDHAALHHVLDDGWVWVLRFNNGVTSAGVMYDGDRRPPEAVDPAAEWAALLRRYPSVGRQFADARPVLPWVRTGRVQRKARRAAGADWAMLAHAAYFLDPLFSSGNAHSLLTIERLTRIFARHWGRPTLRAELEAYEAALLREVDFVDRLVHGSYRAFRRFDLLAAFTMYYFAGAIHSEERRRAGLAGERDEFLFSHHPPFRAAFVRGYERLLELAASPPSASATREYERQVTEDIAPYNTAGLSDPAKHNMYPFL
jgi:tetracycline 7-halogenase / FADH2 O2-dependent halogenase